jgi:hypothetical protein
MSKGVSTRYVKERVSIGQGKMSVGFDASAYRTKRKCRCKSQFWR